MHDHEVQKAKFKAKFTIWLHILEYTKTDAPTKNVVGEVPVPMLLYSKFHNMILHEITAKYGQICGTMNHWSRCAYTY